MISSKSSSRESLDYAALHHSQDKTLTLRLQLQPYFSLHEEVSGKEGFAKKGNCFPVGNQCYFLKVRGKNFCDVGAHNFASKMSVI